MREYREFTEFGISEVKDEARGVKTFSFDKELDARPGQFVTIRIPGISANPFSISYLNPLGVTVKEVGDFTSEMFRKKPGDPLLVRGPKGNSFEDFIPDNLGDYTALFMAGGYGSPPVAWFAETSRFPRKLGILGAGYREDLVFEERMRGACNHLTVCTEKDNYGETGMVTDFMGDIKDGHVVIYACGPIEMLKGIGRKAGELGLAEPENIICAVETHFKCDDSVCGNCEILGRRMCIDGPVVRYSFLENVTYKRDKCGVRIPLR